MQAPLARVLLTVAFAGTTAAMLSELPAPPQDGEGAPPVATGPGLAPCPPAPLAARAGQVLLVGLPGVTEPSHPLVGEVLDAHAGGVLLTGANVSSAAQVRRLVDGIRSRAGRPLVVATDEESGRVSAFRKVLGPGPSPRRLARTSTPAGARRFAAGVGARLAALGVDLDLAPVADLAAGPAGGIVGDRSFSGDPDTVTRYALAYARGLSAGGVRPTAKHFPGHGPTPTDTHDSLPTVDVTLPDLAAKDLRPFAALIGEGVPAVLVGHVAYTSLGAMPASLSPAAYRLLRESGFRGVAITDSLDMGAVHPRWSFPDAAVQAVRAGTDAVLSADGRPTRTMRDALVRAVHSGQLDERRLNEAAGRMITLAGGDAATFVCQRVELPTLR